MPKVKNQKPTRRLISEDNMGNPLVCQICGAGGSLHEGIKGHKGVFCKKCAEILEGKRDKNGKLLNKE